MFCSVIVAVNVYVIYLFKYIPVLPFFLRQGGLAIYYRLVINLKYSCLCLVSVGVIRTNGSQRSTSQSRTANYFQSIFIFTYIAFAHIYVAYGINTAYIYTIFI